MTEQMDRIWDAPKEKDIHYRAQDTDAWLFSTSYHGEGRFLVTIKTRTGRSGAMTFLHMSREELETLGDAIATSLGGCLYLGREDADSEMTP